jgi:BirA family biotin operon repressor/biotin-[acetyl-CoA-carboxylase] ligase
MTLTADAVYRALGPRPVRFYERADSTNDLALDWLREGAATGSLVIADEQVKGRGRLGRTWYTPPGTALILSVILRPSALHLPQMTMLGGVALTDTLNHLGAPDVGIKWPNDVQLNGRKVSGILPEAVWEGDKLVGVVLGMGVNVRIDFSGSELAQTAISIEPALGRMVNRLDVLADLLSRIDYWYGRLDTVFAAWKSRLNMLGKLVTVQNAMISGWAENVDEQGALLVKDAKGQSHRVVAGDVALGS